MSSLYGTDHSAARLERGLRAHHRNHLFRRPAVNGAGLIALTTGDFLTHESK